MAELKQPGIRTLKRWFEDAGRDDSDTTESDLISLVDEVLAGQNESDERYALTAKLIGDLETRDGVAYTSRRK